VARYAGIAAATAGRTEEAIAELERALTMARRWGAEPVVAATRLDLAGVVQAGDPARAATLRADALAAARRLGLTALLERAGAAQDAPAPSPPPAAPAAGRRAALYRRGDIWTLAAGGRAAQLRDAKGLHHLHRLLAAPHVELHALQLSTADARRAAGAGLAAAADGLAVRPRGAGDAGPVLDPAAKAAYRRRSADLEAEAGEAEALHDDERAARAREELAFVARELAGAVGLRGRDRRVGSDAERARVSVTRAIRAALRRIAGTDPDLGAHLDAAVRTGTFCVYAPDAGDELTWDLSGPP
jgi:non-specific serine/threonine protein kinase